MHLQLSQLYGPNVTRKQMVHHWCRQFTAGQQHVHDADDFMKLVWECIMEHRRFTITELSSHFPLLVAQNCHGSPVQKIVCQSN